MRAVVVGGGITGLTAAYTLGQRARRAGLPLRTTLIERRERLGGVILTERVDGFVVEGGPDSFLSTKPEAMELCEELGLAAQLQRAIPRRRIYVLRRGQLIQIPNGLAMMVPTSFGAVAASPLLSPLGKLRWSMDLIMPRRRKDSDESVRSFVSRRLGREAYERLIEPLVAGVYGGDGAHLSVQAALPIWRDWENRYGSLIRGARVHRNASDDSKSIFVTLKDGLGELVQALEQTTQGVEIRTSLSIAEIQRVPGGFRLATQDHQAFDAQVVILAAPAFAAARILSKMDGELAQELRAIEYSSSATVSLAYRLGDVEHSLDGHGYLIPRRERRPALACTWTSEKFPHRASRGRALLRVFFAQSEDTHSAIDDQDFLRRAAQDELGQTLRLRVEPLFTRVFRWPGAMPQYTVGHQRRVDAIRSRLAQHPGLLLAGAAYDGVGIPDCIHSGRTSVEQAMAELLRTGQIQRLS